MDSETDLPTLSKIQWLAFVIATIVATSLAHSHQGGVDRAALVGRGTESRGPVPVQRLGKWGFINAAGTIVIPPQFDAAAAFYEGLAAVHFNGLGGYVDATGKVVIPLRFTKTTRFSDGLANVSWHNPRDGGSSSGYVDRNGQVAFTCEPGDRAARLTSNNCSREFSGGFVAEAMELFRCVEEPGNPKEYPCKAVFVDRWGYYDKSGRIALSGPFSSGAGPFVNGLAAVSRHREMAVGFINASSTWVISPKYDQAMPFSEGLAAVRLEKRWGFINTDAEFVIEPRFQSPSSFSEGLAAMRVGQRLGYIDRSGAFVIEPQFQDAAAFSEGLAAVCCDGDRTRYIERSGRWAFDATFPRAISNPGAFVEGIALVVIDGGRQAYIDRTGRVVAPVRERD